MKYDLVPKNKIASIQQMENKLVSNQAISKEDAINFIKDFIEDHKRLSNLSVLYGDKMQELITNTNNVAKVYGSKMQELIKHTNQTVDYSVATNNQLHKLIEVLDENVKIANAANQKIYNDIKDLQERVSKLENKLKLKNKRKLKNGKRK